jgi:hypothetical protein
MGTDPIIAPQSDTHRYEAAVRVYPGSYSRHPLGPCLANEALFIFKCDSQGCANSCDELSHVILPVSFLGKIAALAPTRTEIIQEWLAGLRRRNSQ